VRVTSRGLENTSPGLQDVFPIHWTCVLNWTVDRDLLISQDDWQSGAVLKANEEKKNQKVWSKFSAFRGGRVSFYCMPYANIPGCFGEEEEISDNVGRFVALKLDIFACSHLSGWQFCRRIHAEWGWAIAAQVWKLHSEFICFNAVDRALLKPDLYTVRKMQLTVYHGNTGN